MREVVDLAAGEGGYGRVVWDGVVDGDEEDGEVVCHCEAFGVSSTSLSGLCVNEDGRWVARLSVDAAFVVVVDVQVSCQCPGI